MLQSHWRGRSGRRLAAATGWDSVSTLRGGWEARTHGRLGAEINAAPVATALFAASGRARRGARPDLPREALAQLVGRARPEAARADVRGGRGGDRGGVGSI